ncbi:MAG: class I SAM-dependent methyltransferase [Myxococcales bacterium]|nr:MAG: class I SAM-dependent methyltransferase [Myxococcales bacterium]
MTDRRNHWEAAYQSKDSETQSWFQPRPVESLALIEMAGCSPLTRIIDVGGGTSLLVDELITQGCRNLSVLDISASALEESKRRLGMQAEQVLWIEADIAESAIDGNFDIWHDRAVFHFLTETTDKRAYVHTLKKSLKFGGHAIIATFAEDGPTRCSGLPVVQYHPSSLLAELGEGFTLVETRKELHHTPAGRDQSFVYCLFRHTDAARQA